MANGPLTQGLLGAANILATSQQIGLQRQQVEQKRTQAELNNAFKMINLGLDLEDDDLTQSGLNIVNRNFKTTISTDAIGKNRKAFKKEFGILVEEGQTLMQNPQNIPTFRQAVNNFNIKYSTGRFAEQTEAVVTGAEATIGRAEEAETLGQREIARGIPQEGVVTPLQERQRAAIAGGFTPSEVTGLGKPPTLTERKAEAFGRLSDEEQENLLKKAGVSVTIDLGKATKTTVEKQIIEGQKIIGQLNRIETTFKDEYLTYKGKGIAVAQRFANKLGLDTGTQFLEERSRWFNQAKQAFFVYRKWVTGVAGGEKEMADIAKAFADPERNSPAEYRANLNETRLWKRAVDKWLRETKKQGLSIGETREIIEQAEPGSAFEQEEDLSDLSDEELLNRL